ncbi:MAG TPA: ImmA/IrrE family metallo-endopeptidase [Acidobacteriaceae bacterium]|jgi:Zn-dependent peptidase ImmA (M78 family)|nr:ImmA/IrrE family metallo-endopeptidase [Acidobacteriaceae bacterium]
MFRRGFKTSSEETALKIRRKLELAPHAPVDPGAIARLLAIPVLLLKELSELPDEIRLRLMRDHSDAWSAITVSDGNKHLIVLNPTHAPTRTNSSLAHEIAHVILSHEPSMMFVTPQSGVSLRTYNKDQEDEANWLAGCILLPRDALVHIRHRGLTDDEITAEYGVSPAMFRFRINATGVDLQARRAKQYQRSRRA